jgi:uncharacterized protein (DUF983 family)
MLPDTKMFTLALAQKCPRCGQGDLYLPGIAATLHDRCASCGLDLKRNDAADGPAVFLIFILGFLLVPAALLLESLAHPPLWVHGVLWTVVALSITIGSLRPIKAYIIALQYKHRASDWDA